MKTEICFILFTVVLFAGSGVDAHAQMEDPPARSMLYMLYPGRGFVRDPFVYFNQLNCGGMGYQYSARCNGKCGVCGDKCDDPNPANEAGGILAKGFITRTFTMGQVVNIKIHLWANHKGYFEFRLCPNNDFTKRITQQCLDQHVLQLADRPGTRYPIYSANGTGIITVPVRLPPNVVCSQCVLQWKMHNGNSWGTDLDTGRSCLGCGNQEEFYGCSDVAIVSSGGGGGVIGGGVVGGGFQPIGEMETTTPKPPQSGVIGGGMVGGGFQPIDVMESTSKPPNSGDIGVGMFGGGFQPIGLVETSSKPPQSGGIGGGVVGGGFQPIGVFESQTEAPTSPKNPQLPQTCRALGLWAGSLKMDQWCTITCANGACPPSACQCQ